MTPYAEVWHFTRARLDQALFELTDEQLTWRPNDSCHTIAEILYHVAGAEHYWATRLEGREPGATPFEERLDRAVREGFLREGGCPFPVEEHTVEATRTALDFTLRELGPIIENPTHAQLNMTLQSPIGDDVTGRQGLARIAQHAGYHTGQIWMIRSMPGFPKSA